MNLDKIEKSILRTEAKIVALKQQRDDIIGTDTKIKCGSCSHTFSIKDATFIQPHWYESPHGCMGGDIWHMDKNSAYVSCPECSATLNLYWRPDIFKHKRLFKEIKDVYDRQS